MLDSHPPFQIDGNFGGAAGIAESLLQSHEGYITLLPAVAKNLSGSFTRLKARGNIEVSAAFKNGKVTSFVLAADTDNDVKVKIAGASSVSNGSDTLSADNGFFMVIPNKEYAVRY